jgi:hypothetical protein
VKSLEPWILTKDKTMGNMIIALATLEQTSVKTDVKRMTISRRTGVETSPSNSNSSPNQAESPEYSKASAIAKPLPSNNKTPHGIFADVNFQLNSVSYSDELSLSEKS